MVPGSSERETPGYAVEMETIGKELGGIRIFHKMLSHTVGPQYQQHAHPQPRSRLSFGAAK